MENVHTYRILLGQLNSNGDCLYATTIAKQIKKDYPNCHLTWAIGSYCSKIIANNPDVDATWEIPLKNAEETRSVWKEFRKDAIRRKDEGEFDEIFLVQFVNENYLFFDGTLRSSIFKAYPHSITVPIEPIVILERKEIENVLQFSKKNQLSSFKNVILFECAPLTNQAAITPHIAYKLSEELVKFSPDTCIILSSNKKIDSDIPNIVDGSSLTLRENAELTKYCTLLVGCSSGITWISTSSWAKKIPMIQLLNPKAIFLNSVVNDHERWGLPTDHIVELPNYNAQTVLRCLKEFIQHDIQSVKSSFHKKIPVGWHTYQHLLYFFLKNYQYSNAWNFVKKTSQEHQSAKLVSIYAYSLIRFFLIKLPRQNLSKAIVGLKEMRRIFNPN